MSEVLSLLEERLKSTGLSKEQVDEYVWFIQGWHREDIEHGQMKEQDLLPCDACLRTLAEAQRIVRGLAMNKVNPRKLHVMMISRFLSIPDTQWKDAKKLIAKFFDRKESVVDTLYNGDEGWLLKTAEECLDAALYIHHLCPGNLDLAWKIFYHSGIAGRKRIEKNVDIIFEMIGPEDGLKLIEIDVCHDNWLFYCHSSDTPARCVAYLKQCGLSNPQILELISKYGYILNLFGKTSDEAKVDSIIDRFLYDWVKHHGPCYDGLTLEEIDFLVHGPCKLEG